VSDTGFRHLGDREVFAGRIWRVVVADFEHGGATFTRDIVRSPGSVGVVPLRFDAEGNPSVVLVAQYRPALDRVVLEVPAGMRDVDGEPAEDTARRELQEEVGLAAGVLEPLTAFEPSAGMTDSVCTLFLATHLTEVPDQRHGPEEDAMEVVVLPLADAVARAASGEITDAKTVIGLLLAERWLVQGDRGR
jgi:ADP-ribose pyrophosphatase